MGYDQRAMSADVEYLSAQQAAARCSIAERTVRRWIESGRLKADKSGREFQIAAADLEPFIRRNGRDSEHAAAPAGVSAGHAAAAPPMSADVSADALQPPADLSGLSDAFRLIERQQQTIMELAGRVGFYQAQVEQLREQLALEAPRVEVAASSLPRRLRPRQRPPRAPGGGV